MSGPGPGFGINQNTDLVALFEAAWAEGSYGPANGMLIEFLESKLKPIRREFKVDIDDCVGRAWRLLAEKHTKTGFGDVPNALAWLRKALRNALNNASLAETHLVDEETVKSGQLKKARDELAPTEHESLLDRSLDFADWEAFARQSSVIRVSPVPNTAGPHLVWEAFAGVLLKLGWSGELASECVRASEEYLQKVRTGRGSKANEGGFSRALPDAVPKGVRINLARFVLDPRGYVVAVLEGTPPGEALLFSQVRKALPGLVWKDI